jgi:hypothetical protein
MVGVQRGSCSSSWVGHCNGWHKGCQKCHCEGWHLNVVESLPRLVLNEKDLPKSFSNWVKSESLGTP